MHVLDPRLCVYLQKHTSMHVFCFLTLLHMVPAHIRSAMRRAGGRDLSSELEPHWQQLVVHRFPQAVAGGCQDRGPQLSSGHSISSSGDGSSEGGGAGKGGAWRALYDTLARAHAEKGQRIRDKVQRMFDQDRAAKQQRCTQVCCAMLATNRWRPVFIEKVSTLAGIKSNIRLFVCV